jgi:hypothetical protein
MCSNLAGNIASLVTQTRFKVKFGVADESDSQYANTKGWIVSIATAGAVFGCLGVGPSNILLIKAAYANITFSDT